MVRFLCIAPRSSLMHAVQMVFVQHSYQKKKMGQDGGWGNEWQCMLEIELHVFCFSLVAAAVTQLGSDCHADCRGCALPHPLHSALALLQHLPQPAHHLVKRGALPRLLRPALPAGGHGRER